MNFLPQYAFRSPVKRFLAAGLDAQGSLLFFPANFLAPKFKGQLKNILVVRLDHLGDVAMTRPAIGLLHERFPSAAIDLLVSDEIAGLFEDERCVRNIIGF